MSSPSAPGPSGPDRDHADQDPRERGESDGPLEDELEEAFDLLVDEAAQRLGRSNLGLFATGLMGGTEVAFGVLALVAVVHETGSHLLGGLAFSIGFIAILLAKGELFTEGFLLPVLAVAAKRARPRHLARHWSVVLVANLVGGWLIMWLIATGFPEFRGTLHELAAEFAGQPLSARTFSLAVLAGAAITLMTRMQSGTEEVSAQLVAAISFGFVLAGLGLFHSILDSLLIFGAIHAGDAPIDYGDWLSWLWYTLAGNMLGGLGLVTLLRLLRSRDRLVEERAAAGD